MITITIAVLMLLNEADNGTLSKVVGSWRFVALHYVMLFLSIVYGWLVRAHVYYRSQYGPPNSMF